MKRLFRTEVRAIYADTDAMGVVYHANYIRWFELGRTELMHEIGFPGSELEKIPLLMPIASAFCEYKKPAFYDDLLEIVTYVDEIGYVSMIVKCEIFRKTTGELLAKGHTRHGFTNDKLKPISAKKFAPEFYGILKDASIDKDRDES